MKGFILASMLLVNVQAQRAQSQEAPKSVVKLEVTTAAGDVLPSPKASLMDSAGDKEMAVFHHSIASGVSHGDYILRVREPGFKWYEQRIEVRRPRELVQVRLAVADILDTVPLK
jgi:hypothetical protein